MRAIVCHRHGGPEVMQHEEVPRPEPADGELLLKTEAIGVNYVDTMRRSGEHPTAPAPPFIPGIELCGRVVALGSGVTGFREDERVIGETHPLRDAALAHRRLVSRRTHGKIVLIP